MIQPWAPLRSPTVPSSIPTDLDFNICVVTDNDISRRVVCRALAGYQGFTKNYHPWHSSIRRDTETTIEGNIYHKATPRDDTKVIYKPIHAYNRSHRRHKRTDVMVL